MKPSSEIKDRIAELFQAAANGDTATIDRMYSREPGTLQIGTDPEEWWQGKETITGIWRSQIEALGGGMPVAAEEIQAWQEGDFGWAAAKGAVRVPGQPDMPLRFTGVFHREDGEWRMVQGHGSIGVANEETTFGDLPE